MDTSDLDHCPQCGAGIGELHATGCDVEQCPYCGGQLLSCFCFGNNLDFVPADDRMVWTGEDPGVAECLEFGWFAKRSSKGWVPCGPDEPNAIPDLNRLHVAAVWDREQKRFVKKAR